MADLAILMFGLMVIPLSYILSGWVLGILWGWFIVPFGLPPIMVPNAIGLAIVVGFLTKQMTTRQCRDNRDGDEKREGALALLVSYIFSPLIALLVGWIVYQFVR